MTVSPVGFNSSGVWGLLFVYDSKEYLHCFTVQNIPYFILVENIKKQFLYGYRVSKNEIMAKSVV